MSLLVKAHVFDTVNQADSTSCAGASGVANSLWNVVRGVLGLAPVELTSFSG